MTTHRSIRIIVMFAFVFALASIWFNSTTVRAESSPGISAGCKSINGLSSTGTGGGNIFTSVQTYYQGETITVRMSAGGTNPYLEAHDDYIFDEEFAQADGRVISFTIPYTGDFLIHTYGSINESLSITVSISCGGSGPGAPTGFVQRTITCDTAVFSQVDGSPVSGAVIKAGQRWYVNPTPVVGKQRSWTEIFVASYTNGWIPTSCVK